MTSAIHIIAGPTASGKSARALALAREQNGVIINADATQLYADLRIVSARPSEAEMMQVPHRLYGFLPGEEAASAGKWLGWVKPEIEAAWAAGQLPILCGGTGLYLKALQEGLSPMPEVPVEVRAAVAARLAEIGKPAFYAELQKIDPAGAAHVGPHNTQRLLRAREVVEASGETFSAWMQKPREKLFPEARVTREVIELSREELYRRCDARFAQMMEHGAIEEVQTLLAKGYGDDAPVMKAVGVREIAAYLRGEMTKERVVELGQQNTRRYAKRQLTWLRHQVK
jgi:tRNA dimethylallyltransferase